MILDANINQKLLEIQIEWNDKIVEPFIEANPEQKNELSLPFYFGVPDKYRVADKKVMIVGQEAYNWWKYLEEADKDYLQQWAVGYLEKQLWQTGEYRFNNSAFWMFFRQLNQSGFTPCWNNIDKLHRYVDQKTKPLTAEQDRVFCAQYGSNNKSLLQREIELVNPDAIIFIIGPNYQCSLEHSFGLQTTSNQLSQLRPTLTCPCPDIASIIRMDVPVIWTYHPTYMNRKGMLKDCVNTIGNLILNR